MNASSTQVQFPGVLAASQKRRTHSPAATATSPRTLGWKGTFFAALTALALLVLPLHSAVSQGIQKTKDVSSPAEAQHRAQMDRAIAPLLNVRLTATDADNLKAAFKALRKKNVANALQRARAIQNPLARKMVQWYRLRTGQADLSEFRPFIDANPNWPNIWLIKKKFERKIFDLANPAVTLQHFQNYAPDTPPGHAARAAALLASGNKQDAMRIAVNIWRNDKIDAGFEKPFLKQLGHLLSPADHKWRFDRLIIADIRWRKSRNARAAVLRRQLPRLAKAEQTRARARLAAFSRKKNARGKLNKVAPSENTDWGLVFQKIEASRRAGRITEASKLMLSAPTDLESTVNPDAWWGERRRLAYEALDHNNPKLAYALVADAGPLTVNPLKAQHFLAGWLALRYLHDPQKAIGHFTIMNNAADGPLSRSKSAYWLARAYEAAGDNTRAAAAYQKAMTGQVDTFHALLSRQRLDPSNRQLYLTPPALPTSAQAAAFQKDQVATAAVFSKRAGLGSTIQRQFIARLAKTMATEAEVAMVAHLSQALGDTQQALRVGKKAIARGMNLIYYAYPLHAFPDYKPLRTPPETAFLLGIARQESEFNTLTLSGAGARGILQVMPITARHVCRDYKIKCNIKRLMSDESYNTKIASAYTADRMGEFGGSYVLGLSGYNAGPGRTRQWIKRFGDPRDGRIDPIDWIERLPFKETRQYVAKVLSNIQIYRARLGQTTNALRLDQDLARAQKPVPKSRRLVAPRRAR